MWFNRQGKEGGSKLGKLLLASCRQGQQSSGVSLQQEAQRAQQVLVSQWHQAVQMMLSLRTAHQFGTWMLTEADRCQTPRLRGCHFKMQLSQSILATCHQKNNYLAFPHPYPLHAWRFSSVLTVSRFGEPEETENSPEAPWSQSVWWGVGLRGEGELGLCLSEVPLCLVTSAVPLDRAKSNRHKMNRSHSFMLLFLQHQL